MAEFDPNLAPVETEFDPKLAAVPTEFDPKLAAVPTLYTPTGVNRPNIFLLMLDDVGTEALRAYDVINKQMGLNTVAGGESWSYPYTPTIDAEAARGVTFNEFYCYPFCSPSRWGVQTGRYGFRTGVGSVIRKLHEGDSPAGYLDAASLTGIPEVCIPHFADIRGEYDHALIGKLHLSEFPEVGGAGYLYGRDYVGFNVVRATAQNTDGDEHISAQGGYAPGYWNYRWGTSDADTFEQLDGLHATTRTKNNVKGWINNVAKKPWICFMPVHAAHTPLGSPQNATNSGAFPGNNDTEVDAATWGGSAVYDYDSLSHATDPPTDADQWLSWRAAVEHVDKMLDDIINGANGLKATGQYDNTVFIIMGDNGTAASVIRSAAAAGEDVRDPIDFVSQQSRMKGSVFRQGARAPLIVSGPVVRGTLGRVSNIRIDAVDIWKTIAEMIGVNPSLLTGTKKIDSISFRPSLSHESSDPFHSRDFNLYEVFKPNGDPFNLVDGLTSTGGAPHRWDRGIQANASSGTHYSYKRLLDGTEFFFDLDADLLEIANSGNGLPLSGADFTEIKARFDAIFSS